jgi:hypothetical protein
MVRAALGNKEPGLAQQIVHDATEVVGLSRSNTPDLDLDRVGELDRRRVVALDRGVGDVFLFERLAQRLYRRLFFGLEVVFNLFIL